MPHHAHERRGPSRPSNGDIAACPKCAQGTVEFSERTRDADIGVTSPAWSCDACGFVQPARRVLDSQSPGGTLRYTAKRLRAKSMRMLMKSRSARLAADRGLAKNAARKKGKAD